MKAIMAIISVSESLSIIQMKVSQYQNWRQYSAESSWKIKNSNIEIVE